MKKICIGIVLIAVIAGMILFVMTGCSGGNMSPSASNPQNPVNGKELAPHVEGQVIVRLKKDITGESVASLVGGVVLENFSIGTMQYAILQLPQAKTVETSLAELENHPWIDYAEPNYILETCVVPNDPSYEGRQYAHKRMNSEAGWNVTTGSTGITIAVVDTGVDGTHPEFTGRMTAGLNAITETPLTGNENSDDNFHGTHVAGIAAATGNNGIGVAGVDWNARIMPVKVLDSTGSGSIDSGIRGVLFAINNNAAVINMSFGAKGYSQAFKDALDLARQKEIPGLGRGIVLVASMGNSHVRDVLHPAAVTGTIAVGSTDAKDNLSSFSSRGKWISVSAPGQEIYSTIPTFFEEPYRSLNGTSMSTPQVAGLVSLLRGLNNSLTAEQIRSIIEGTADDLGTPGHDEEFGYGRINIGRALTETTPNKYGTVAVTVKLVTPQSGVDVILEDSATGATITTARTNAAGIAYFYDIPAGNYRASAVIMNVVDKTNSFTVTPGTQADVEIDFGA